MAFQQRYVNTRAQIITGAAGMFTEDHGSSQAEIDAWNTLVADLGALCTSVFGAADPGDPRRQIQIETKLSGAIHNDTGRFEITLQRVAPVGTQIASSLAVTPDLMYPPPP